jgi:glycosyltransferase involved in cell wall biosynthesis
MISVITPVYNGERFIGECIQVVIAQRHPNLEHIIVDGDSTDRTVEIIKQDASKYSHIRWISEKDRGQTDALNKGIAMARGDILAILNVDDYYEPGVLNRVSEIFSGMPDPSLIVGNCNIWDDDGNLLYVNKPSKLKISDLLLGFNFYQHPVNPSAYFYHTSLHQKIGPYRDDMQIGQDLPFLLNAVQIATVKYFDELWGNYRQIKGTLTVREMESGIGQHRYNAILNSFIEQMPFIKQLEIAIKKSLLKIFRRTKNWSHRITRLLRKEIKDLAILQKEPKNLDL